jgi:glycosyltransferase involved in cell wall biosynthesis
MLKYSIIVPCYNVSKYLPSFLKNIPTNRNDFEIIFIDDKSIDNTADIVRDFCKQNKNFNLISLSKNIGAGLAILEGIKQMKTN